MSRYDDDRDAAKVTLGIILLVLFASGLGVQVQYWSDWSLLALLILACLFLVAFL